MLRIRLKQEAAVSECNVASLRQIEVLRQSMNIHFSEALWLLSCKYLYTIEGIVYTNLTIEHQVFFQLSYLLCLLPWEFCTVLCLHSFLLFCFACLLLLLHTCLTMYFTWFLWLFATDLSCQHLDFSMPELQLQLCLDWDQHDWPFMPSIKSVSEHYLVCQVHNMNVSIVLDKDA